MGLQACRGSASCLLSIPFTLRFVNLVCVRREPVPTDRVLLCCDTYVCEQKAAWTDLSTLRLTNRCHVQVWDDTSQWHSDQRADLPACLPLQREVHGPRCIPWGLAHLFLV